MNSPIRMDLNLDFGAGPFFCPIMANLMKVSFSHRLKPRPTRKAFPGPQFETFGPTLVRDKLTGTDGFPLDIFERECRFFG